VASGWAPLECHGRDKGCLPNPSLVITGLDPVTHDDSHRDGGIGGLDPVRERVWPAIMGCRVKPGNDEIGGGF
jgi:hypothetical protein